jgi:hypothetical protein|tara:strand:- start:1790 stop:2194 length:405 start_codon:yes stop_codon:yes gene_type:complete
MTEEKIPSAEIIKGPWRKTINTPTVDEIEQAEQLVYFEEIAHTCLMSILPVLVDNQIYKGEEDYTKNITFITESIKALILKSNNISHPLQVLIDMIIDTSIDPDDTPFCEIDEHTIGDIVASYNAVMEPNDDIS